MKSNTILLIGSLLVLIASLLWYFEIISEPTVAIATGILTSMGFILARRKEGKQAAKKTKGGGDKVEGNKTTIEKSKNVVSGNEIEVSGNMHVGDVIHKPGKKKVPKELTPLHTVNPGDIIGRGKDLEELHGLLFNNKKVVVVNGLGGIGKTTLAEAYAFKYYDGYKHMAWVTQNAENLANDFAQSAELIQKLDIATAGKEPPAIFGEILGCLRGFSKGPNLLVIDNALPSLEAHLHLLPGQPNWHLLVTSRQQIAGLHAKELGFLPPAEAAGLFKKHCTLITDEAQIAALVKTVDYHTLTIEILAKTAQRQRTDMPRLQRALEDDLQARVKTKHSHLQKIERVTSYLSSIFDLSNLTEQETWLIKQFACLPPVFHSYQMLEFLLLTSGQSSDFCRVTNPTKTP
jgi:NB-ARC domain-containing protein